MQCKELLLEPAIQWGRTLDLGPFQKLLLQDFELHVVDTAGQDEYSIFPTQYAVDIHGWEFAKSQHFNKQMSTCFPQVCPRLLHQQSEKLRGGAGIAFTWGNDFDALQVLYDKIADLVGNPRVPVVLVGNKKDLEVKKRNLVLNMNNEH